jgi:hypothetical protein
VGRRGDPRTTPPGGAPASPAEYAAATYREAQALRYRAHEKLMRAFLDESVFEGRVRVEPQLRSRNGHQQTLLDDAPSPDAFG